MTTPIAAQSLDLHRLAGGYADGSLTPTAVVAEVHRRIAARGDDAVWIHLVPEAAALAAAAALEARPRAELPLYGVPFAVKDNIDVAGLPTTAACPAFAYVPARSAPAVERLLAAGAILIGKTNLDQFATGLVGVRSPYGTPRNPFDPEAIPGGSSSGSAVAVAAGLVGFALGTDTAGSGRVPAGFTNTVGLKPSGGAISAAGVVPACRSLDCVSVFALTVPDAMAVLAAAQAPDPADPYSRQPPPGWAAVPAAFPAGLRFGVPRQDQQVFFGDSAAAARFDAAVARLAGLGGTAVEIDFAPFAAAAALLYSGPWVAERTAALGTFLDDHAEAIWPVTRQIIAGGKACSAVDAFTAAYRLAELRQRTLPVWRDIDLMLVPTSGTIYRIAEVEAEPIALNTNLGFYTNFVNLLDLCALAVPNGFLPAGLPAGVTLIAPAWSESLLAAVGEAFHRAGGMRLGATAADLPPPVQPMPAPPVPALPVAVFGAHLSGQPLNGQLLALGARLRRACRTRPVYRMHVLTGGGPPRPGLVRVEDGSGAAIAGEIWDVPTGAVGVLLAGIVPPLGLGTVELEDGTQVKGFLCEAHAAATAPDITRHGDWRRYLEAHSGAHRRQDDIRD